MSDCCSLWNSLDGFCGRLRQCETKKEAEAHLPEWTAKFWPIDMSRSWGPWSQLHVSAHWVADCSSSSSQTYKQEVKQGFVSCHRLLTTHLQHLLPKHFKHFVLQPVLLPLCSQAGRGCNVNLSRWYLSAAAGAWPSSTTNLQQSQLNYPHFLSVFLYVSGREAGKRRRHLSPGVDHAQRGPPHRTSPQ